ncbi:hypothetical protein Acsp03_42970 [Actinomadura sp. NBRC 104412]|uniref:hypothetical protein n=1 Tax=Actinomadura sp. NBRC 104412 TaxID=3032203 RepID=UPI00249F967D|nr:hypothetical protein [Actinomadura sp. NBRC 104412]GLZ06831.1 hypothetical protein Acsp03_42970 [Actinomadura sp. NBRC 104412]
MDFSSAARELYGVPPGEFTSTRERLVQEARSEGDAALAKRIGALRRPTLPAWAVNLLSRFAADDLGELLDVGARLREAWASGGGIGGLEQRRGELVTRLVRKARDLAGEAGRPLRDPAVREVEDTLQAATVDGDIAEEVRQGRLTHPRSHTGFVPAGFPVAEREKAEPEKAEPEKPRREKPRREKAPRAEAPPRRAEDTRRAEARERARQAAVRRAEKAARDLAERETEHAEAREDLRTADAEVGRLRRELDKVRRDLDRAVARQESAERRLEKAEQRRDKAARAAREARRKVDEVSGDAAPAI